MRDQAAAQPAEHGVVPEASHARGGMGLVDRVDDLEDVRHRGSDQLVAALLGCFVAFRAVGHGLQRVVPNLHAHVHTHVQTDVV